MERIPPQDIRAEQSVLGSILLDNNSYYDIAEIIVANDFYKPLHVSIFEAIEKLAKEKEPIDIITLQRKVDVDVNYITELMNITPTTSNIKYHAKIIEDMSRLRRLIKYSTDVINKAYELGEADEVTGIMEKAIHEVSKKSDGNIIDARKLLEIYLEGLEDRCSNKGHIPGLPTGFYDVDIILGGLQKGNFYLVGARPSMGKTAFVTNIATFISVVKKEPVALFSLEMNKEQIMNRIVSSFGMIDSNLLKLGRLNDSDWEKIAEIIPHIELAPLVVDDSSRIKVLEIESKARRIKNKYGKLGLIVIDYLQLITPSSKGGSREQEVSEISRSLKILAKELECPVICLAQLSRQCEQRNDKRPMLSDLRESGSIEQDADVVMFIYRDDYYNPDSEKKNIAEIIIAKGRNEGTGTIELAWLGQYTKFCNLEKVR